MSSTRIEPHLIYMVLIIIFSVITTELIALLIDYYTNITQSYLVILDAIILVVILTILLFLFVYEPLSTYTNKIIKLNEDLDKVKTDLLTSEQKFRLIADYSYDWEYWEGLDKSLVYVSPSCAAITGYSPEEFYENKKLIKEIIDPKDRIKLKNYHHTIIKGGEIIPLEFRITTKSGETRWIDHVCRSVYNNNGDNCGIRVSNRDITKIKLLKKEIKVLKGLLPICASCKNIRDDKGYWNQIESYIQDHSEAEFTHGICPNCAKKLYPDLDLYKE